MANRSGVFFRKGKGVSIPLGDPMAQRIVAVGVAAAFAGVGIAVARTGGIKFIIDNGAPAMKEIAGTVTNAIGSGA